MNHKQIRSAFTLIELLVVIAIIAILAAILFPVFAQAKEAAKKTTAISNAKQMGTSMLMYAGDYDDYFPIAVPPNSSTNTWRTGEYIDTPSDWRPGLTAAAYADRSLCYANSIQPYMKNYGILAAEGGVESSLKAIDYSTATKPVAYNSFTMNGFLTMASQSEVAQVSALPMVWMGYGKSKSKGFAYANPQFTSCAAASVPCRWGSQTASGWMWVNSTDYNVSNASAWYYGKGMVIVRADSSAKFRNVAAVTDGVTWNNASNPINDPFNRYVAGGIPVSMLVCNGLSCYFRLDAEFK